MELITDVVDIKLEKKDIEQLNETRYLLYEMSEKLSKIKSRNTDLEVRDLNHCVDFLKTVIDRYSKNVETAVEETKDTCEEENESFTFSIENSPQTDEELLKTFGDKEWLEEFKKWFMKNRAHDYCLRASYYYDNVGTIDTNIIMDFLNIGTETNPEYKFIVKQYFDGTVSYQIECETMADAIYMYKKYLINFCTSEYDITVANTETPETVAELTGYYLRKPHVFEVLERKNNLTEVEESVKKLVKYLRMFEEE